MVLLGQMGRAQCGAGGIPGDTWDLPAAIAACSLGWGSSPSAAVGLRRAGGHRELPRLLSKGQRWLSRGSGLEQGTLPCLGWCGCADRAQIRGRTWRGARQRLGSFRRGGGAGREAAQGKAPGLACVAGHGPGPLLPPWQGAPGVWGPSPVGVCSAAPSAWAPSCQHLHLQEQRGDGVGGGRAGGELGCHRTPSSWHSLQPQRCDQQPQTPAPHTSPSSLTSEVPLPCWGAGAGDAREAMSPPHRAYLPPCPVRAPWGPWGWCPDPGWYPPSPGGKTTGLWREAGARPALRGCRVHRGGAGGRRIPCHCLGARLPRTGRVGSSCSPTPSAPVALARLPLLSRRPPCCMTRPSPAPAPAPHGPHPAGAEHPCGQVTVCPAGQERGGQPGTTGKGARARRSCWNRGVGGLGRRCCLEMGSKTSEEGSGGRGWLRAGRIGCSESSRVLHGVCPAARVWRREGMETGSWVSQAEPWGWGYEGQGGVGVLQWV